ncbi:TetR/AcrR family transcriptional regulator [Nocardioides sp.]|uniref:TetR/AcrR family transcriptional regulator n=1 Tax=Nocardioides sp. TaxID=35761 RepID=UPI00261CA0D5|nr:TetR/AcrR family transcriptional regulator [Nocardioides sp.]
MSAAAVRQVDKFDQRRAQLAASALATLGERGYARTSLREIAQNSPFSHGVVHYYFANKTELIVHCVREYKKVCVTRYDGVIDAAVDADDLVARFADKLVETLCEDVAMHRLWYDLRTQSMFEDELRADVLAIDHALEEMIWRVVQRYADLADREPVFDPPAAYALLDGLFEQAVLAHLADRPAAEALRLRAAQLMPLLLG